MIDRTIKNPNWHWSKQSNAEEIKTRIFDKRNNNLDYKNKIKMRMTGIENPSRNPISRNKMISSKKNSLRTPRGEKHHNWKGGITKEHNKLRGSLEYILWRNEVYKRDCWTCKICKIKCEKGNIVAHHLKKFSDYPELRFILENGMTLCRKCHAEIENPQYITHT